MVQSVLHRKRQGRGVMEKQMAMFVMPESNEDSKLKRKWENAFQKWSNYMALGEGSINGYGCCGYGSMCDWCKDNSYGRPCVRALNAMCREKGVAVDYEKMDFETIWNKGVSG